jgi:hypothetical protein
MMEWLMINEWEEYGRKRLWLNIRYYFDICLEGLRRTMKDLRQYSRPTKIFSVECCRYVYNLS